MLITLTASSYILALFFVSSIGICSLMLFSGWLLGGKSKLKFNKEVQFESGVNPVNPGRIHLNVKFHLVAIFFVIFDVETIYLFAWAVSIRENGLIGLIEATIFVVSLLIALIYLISVGALDWSSKQSCCYKKLRSNSD